MEENEKKSFVNKLYLDPIENINRKILKPKGFKIKGDPSKEQDQIKVINSLPNLGPNQLMGSVIIQNWETKKNVPEDIGDLIHFPVIIDRNKFRIKEEKTENSLPPIQKNYDFSKMKILKDGNNMIRSLQLKENNIDFTTPSNYLSSQESYINQQLTTAPEEEKYSNIKTKENKLISKSIETEKAKELISITEPSSVPKSAQKSKLIDFTTFKKHLYLRDNDFLYAKRVGGPVDFVLCTYQDINQKSKVPSTSQSLTGRKLLPSLTKKKKNVDYITISKNTVLHYQNGIPSVYSIQEWIDNYSKYKQLMKIPLFKNFRNAKLFDLWRRFYKKTKRQYYTEKLKKRFFFIDQNLLAGIFETKSILKSMKFVNIFDLKQLSPVLLNQFNELHKSNLVEIDRKIEGYRNKVKKIITNSCNESYKEYKKLKKITLDDGNDDKTKKEDEKDNEDNGGSNIQNFIKDSIPYAQDATRKTHYKKLLRYIRAIDYIFNETKFEVIDYSLDMLDKKFKRLYECYVNKWVDPPLLVTKMLCMGDKIYYNPSFRLMAESVFDNFIQETIYCVIYKKNFIDPQEFPRYMSCFEEVFDVSVDQNSNLNNRLKETEKITSKFSSIRDNFENCHKGLNKEVEELKPILNNYLKNNKINFKELEKTATPTYLKDLLQEFHEKEKIIKQLKKVINIGIFEFQLDDLLELVSNAPKTWLEKIRQVIPNVLVAKVKSSIDRMTGHLNELSVNPTDVPSFIKLKKAVEACTKEKQIHEDTSNDILDLQNIIDGANKEIKLQEMDLKLIIELKDISVKYDRKLDSTSYFIDNNIQQFRLDLKNEIAKFDLTIKSMISELNNDVLNTYNEDSFNAIDFLEENSLKIKKCLDMKEKYRQEEIDLEIDDTMKSDFENLENLVYEQELKTNLWNSVKEFQDKSNEWEKEQVLQLSLKEMKTLIKKWLDLCQVAMVDIENPGVPIELKKRVEIFEQLVPIMEAIQNPNISNVPSLLSNLNDLLKTEAKLDDPFLTCSRVKTTPDIFDKLEDFKELNFRANEEKRLQDLIKSTNETVGSRKIPIKSSSYDKSLFDKEFEFVEENLRMLNKIYLNKYCGCILKDLDRLTIDFGHYQNFLTYYVYYQKYVQRIEGIMENNEFMKEMPGEHKKLMNENIKKNINKLCKDNQTLQRFLDHAYSKVMTNIESIIQSYELNYKSILLFFEKKRKEINRFHLLSNDDINEVYQEKESNEVKQKMIYKIYRWIKNINIGGDDQDEIEILTTEDEELTLKYTKSARTLKDLIDFLDMCLVKKLKDTFKSFKKEYELSQKSKSDKKPNDVINELITNKENLGQGIFNCMYYLSMDSLDKSLFITDEAFDKLFDLYNEIKDEKIVSFVKMLRDNKTRKIQRKVLINLISLLNYTKTLIEILIKEDVTSNTDYNFCKLINVKIENDTFNLHFLSYSIEYGYEYVGLQNNFLIMPESERMYISFANCITYKRPFQIYGFQECGKKEILRMFANLCGKRINYLNATKNYSVKGFNNIFYGNLKTGCWICIDESQNIKFDLLEVLALRVGDIYRLLQSGPDDDAFIEDGEKISVNINQFNIFFYRDLSYFYPYEQTSVPVIIKNYYRHLALPKIDYYYYLNQSLSNLQLDNYEEISNRIFYILKYLHAKVSSFKNQNLQMQFISKILDTITEKVNEIEPKSMNTFLRNLFMSIFSPIMEGKEKEEFRKFINEVFEMKDYVEQEIIEEDKTLLETIKKDLEEIKNENYEQQLLALYNALDKFNSFIISGPSLSGKTNLIGALIRISKLLNNIDKSKYAQLLCVKIYPKSNEPDEIFSTNKIERAYKFNNNFFYNMITLFNEENKELLNKLNDHYAKLLGYNEPEVEEDLSPEKLKDMFNTKDNDYQIDEDGGGMLYHQEKVHLKDNIMKILVLDGQIDDTWIEYINNIYDKDNFLDLSCGDKINCRDGYKMFFETNDLKNAPPSFLTRQIIISCSYKNYGWESILYSWIESNPKITENNVLKNNIRGLFENYFPRVQDFVSNNRIKSLTLSTNYVMKVLISIFDSVLPMFNFEDIRIGRRNLNVVPKIEIIKKCTLSIFIFSCAWTMNLLSNFVIKTKIEKLIGDIFKADDLKGPIFDYYIDEETNDFELWTNILKDPYYTPSYGEKGKIFEYGKLFIHTTETIPYTWLCDKLIDMNTPFYFNGKANSGKSSLVNNILTKKSEDELSIRKIKMSVSYYTSPNELEDFLFSNMCIIKRDLFGDKFIKETCLFVDDLNMNIKKDNYGTSPLLEFLRALNANKYLYDSRNNENRFLKKFNICCCGNVTAYPNSSEFNRFLSHFVLITYVTSDDFYLGIFKPSLEFHFRQFIPNTSGITATQYLQASIKLNNLLKGVIQQEPKKLHLQPTIRDVIRIVQAFHDFSFKGQSDYPEYLKKLFFYESSLVYESKLNKKEDIQKYRTKICEAYSSVFKQDKLGVEDIFNEQWKSNDTYIYTKDYDNFNGDDSESKKEHIFVEKKQTLVDYITSKITVFYRGKDIKDKTYVKITNDNINTVIKMLRIMQNKKHNMIMIGKEFTCKKALFDLSAFLSGIEVFEVENSFSHDTLLTKDDFINNVMVPFLVDVTHFDKKSILYIPPSVRVPYILECITKLIDIKEIPNNFIFINTKEYGEITEEDTYNRLEANLSFCIDLIPKSPSYLKLFTNYPSIGKNSSVIYLHSWKNIDMISYLDVAIKELDIKEDFKPSLPELFIEIFNYTGSIYHTFYKKTNIQLLLGQKNYSDVCEFFSSKYNIYKDILLDKQKKYNEALEIIDKIKVLIESTSKQIEECTPNRLELEKNIEENRKTVNDKTREKNTWRGKKQQEDKVVSNLENKMKEKQSNLDTILLPFKEAITKTGNAINKISPADVTEIKNTWDSLIFGKFILQKIFEILGESNNEWDNIKKTLDVKAIKSFIAINPIKSSEKLIPIVKEVTSNPEFSSGDNKYQKPYKACGTFCEYFAACNKYFIEIDKQKSLIEEINNLKDEIEAHNKTIKEYIQHATAIDNEVDEINRVINDLDTKKTVIMNHLAKLLGVRACYSDYNEIASQKLDIWKSKKEIVDIILGNYDFYLMVISSYLIYAPPLSNNYRKEYKAFLYSLGKKLGLKNIKEFDIYEIFLEVIDSSTKENNEFCSSIGHYKGFLADNFTMMFIMNKRIPYLIDYTGMSPEIISIFSELKNPKAIVKSTYNDLSEHGEMFEKLETSMKSGSILFIEQCEENIYNILENLIVDKFSYNPENGKNCYVIKNKKMEKGDKFKIYLIKSKMTSKLPDKAFSNCYVVNFNCPSEEISNSILSTICQEQNPSVLQQRNKVKNDVNKDLFRLMEIEKKLLNYNKQLDLTANLDKLEYNQSLVEKYKVETTTHSTLNKQIKTNSKRLEIFNVILNRYECISNDAAKIYKWCFKLFSYNNLYSIPIEYLSNLVREFYKLKFGLYADMLSKKKKAKKVEDEEADEEEKEEEPEVKEEEKDEDDKLLEDQLNKQKEIESELPTYKQDDAFDMVIFLYNKISQIYDDIKKKQLLLIFLFFGLKQKEEIPTNFKQIIQNINKIYFDNNKEIGENSFKSPVTHIDNRTWNCLKIINDNSSYIFSILIDHIEKHPQEWETFLDDEENLLEGKFNVMDEDLASTLNPFIKFLFFSIIKPNLGDSLIEVTLDEIIKGEEVSYMDENGDTKTKEYLIEKKKTMEELFFQNLNKTRRPLLVFEKENSEVLLQREMKDFFLPKLKSIVAENNAKSEAASNEVVSIKEIIPNKIEFTASEGETIHNAMKNGGIIFINNCYLVKDALLKLIDEIKDPNTQISEFFKLFLIVKSKNLLPSYLYSSCNIINNDIMILTQIKSYLLDLIDSTSTELFNKFMNSEINNISAYYMKKLYIYFTIICVIMIHYSSLKSKIFKIPVAYQRKDYFSALQYLYKYMSSLPEDRQKELHNLDNYYGFTYESLIKIITEIFIYSRLITKSDYERVNNMLTQIYENSFFMKNECLFAYDDFVIMNIDEKKYPINNKINISEELDDQPAEVSSAPALPQNDVKYLIPKSALIQELEKIPNEIYYCLLNGISKQMINEKTETNLKDFFAIVGKGAIDKNKIREEHADEYENEENNEDILINKGRLGKININTVFDRINELKQSLPDSLNTTEANQVLFKINKYNELFNPLDECLQIEIDNFNSYLEKIENDINCLFELLKGNMAMVDDYLEMMQSINNNKVPKEWQMSKFKNQSIDIDDWMKKIKEIYEFFNKWIYEGSHNVYNISFFSNEKLFFTLLPIYFQKKLPEGKVSSDKIKLHFKLSKYEDENEITEEVIKEYKKNNDNREVIFIKGLRLKGFESHKEEDKDIKSFKENISNPNGVLLPIVIISFTIKEYQSGENKVTKEEESDEEEEEEEEEEINLPQQQENENEENKLPEEKPEPVECEPKDDEIEGEKESNEAQNNTEQNVENEIIKKEEENNEEENSEKNIQNEMLDKEKENEIENDKIITDNEENKEEKVLNQSEMEKNINNNKDEELLSEHYNENQPLEEQKKEEVLNQSEMEKNINNNKDEELLSEHYNDNQPLEEQKKEEEFNSKENIEKMPLEQGTVDLKNEEDKKIENIGQIENENEQNNQQDDKNPIENNKNGEPQEPQVIEEEKNKKIIIEEEQIETQKIEIIETKKIEKEIEKKEEIREIKRIRKTTVKYFKKHCKLDIPFIEEQDPNVYNINEPYGFIEIRFNCEKDKQEEYFENKHICIVSDK